MTADAGEQRAEGALLAMIDRCRAISFASEGGRAKAIARLSIIDWFGCAVAGSSTGEVAAVRDALEPAGGPVPWVGTGRSLPWRDAVLLNGVSGHALDYDDMLPALSAHPAAVIVPALLVAGHERGSTVRDIVEAHIAGVEFGVWVAGSLLPTHYDRGWHATGTIGAVAAAAAVARLSELNREQWLTAIDLAATQAAGLQGLFATVGKPLHAGRAAEAAVLAARLAEGGARSSGQGLVGRSGFFAVHGVPEGEIAGPADATARAIEGTLYKSYATCFMTQSVVDGARELLEHAGDPRRVRSLTIEASPKLRDVCGKEEPVTALDAKFSLTAAAGLTLMGLDLADEASFDPSLLRSDRFRELRGRTTVRYADDLIGAQTRTRLTAEFDDDSEWTRSTDRGVPRADLGALERELIRKFERQAGPVLGDHRATALLRAIDDDATAAVLLAATRPAARVAA